MHEQRRILVCLNEIQILLTILSSDNLEVGGEWPQCDCIGSHSALVDIVGM